MSMLKYPKIKNKFKSTWKTDNTSVGSSNNNQVKLPLENGGIYDFVVDWGDSSRDRIIAWNQAETTHTYTSIGTYTIRIYGTCRGWRFNNTADRLKILNISKWGSLELGNSNGYFYGCTNLTITAADMLKNPTMTTLVNAFKLCSSMNGMLNINTSKITSMSDAFNGCTNFNQPVNFNTANCTNMYDMFAICTNFNQPINNFYTNNVTNMAYMLYTCNAFNQDISNFNVENVTNMTSMLQGTTTWSRANYDLALISWAAQNVKDAVPFRCSTQYTLGGAAEAARTHLVGTHGWTITDLGGV